MSSSLTHALSVLGFATPCSTSPLSGGCIASVYRVTFVDGSTAVVKHDAARSATLRIEAMMLRYLAEHSALPVPRVLAESDEALVMQLMPGATGCDADAQRHAAELLVELHAIRAPAFGFERDTLIGPLHQPNPRTESWVEFFSRHRIEHMTRLCEESSAISPKLAVRLRALAMRLAEFINEPPHPSLIHGDAWSGNVLAHRGRITAFIDPAIHYAHPEVELAFMCLFGCFGEPFYSRYHELRPIRPGFFELRRDIYNLYPLLIHAKLFGGGYATSIERTLSRIGL